MTDFTLKFERVPNDFFEHLKRELLVGNGNQVHEGNLHYLIAYLIKILLTCNSYILLVFINAVPAKKSKWKGSATLTAFDENRCYSNRGGKNGTKQTLMIQSVKTVMRPFFGNDFYFAPKHVTKDKEGENNVLGNGGQLFNQLAN